MKEIVLDVTIDGEIKIETIGFKGSGCLKEAEFLERALGKELKRQLTPAYYQVDPNKMNKKYLNLCG